jgi:hypothetical protein
MRLLKGVERVALLAGFGILSVLPVCGEESASPKQPELKFSINMTAAEREAWQEQEDQKMKVLISFPGALDAVKTVDFDGRPYKLELKKKATGTRMLDMPTTGTDISIYVDPVHDYEGERKWSREETEAAFIALQKFTSALHPILIGKDRKKYRCFGYSIWGGGIGIGYSCHTYFFLSAGFKTPMDRCDLLIPKDFETKIRGKRALQGEKNLH